MFVVYRALGFFGLLITTLSMATAQESRTEWIRASDDVQLTFYGFNDGGGDGRDRYLTGGLQLTVSAPEGRVIDFSPLGAPGIVIAQFGGRMYTPADLSAREFLPNDRPYAAIAYLSAGVAAAREGNLLGQEAVIQDLVQLELAASGSWLDFEEIQNDGHVLIGSPQARGWDNQIPAEVFLTARAERMWRIFAKSGDVETEAAPFVALAVGTLENAVTAGVDFSVGNDLGRDIMIRDAGIGQPYAAAAARRDGWTWRAFVGGDLKLVATDATLDGGFFRDGNSVSKELVRYRLRGGIEFRRGGLVIGYALNLLGEEFDRQDEPQVLGSLLISYQF